MGLVGAEARGGRLEVVFEGVLMNFRFVLGWVFIRFFYWGMGIGGG